MVNRLQGLRWSFSRALATHTARLCLRIPTRWHNDLVTLTRRHHRASSGILTPARPGSKPIPSTRPASPRDYRLQHLVRELNRDGAALARSACDEAEARDPGKPRFVIGVLGPTSRTASLSPDVNRPGFRATSFDELAEAYREATRGLVEGGSDVLMVETVFDTLNAKAALFAIDDVFEELGARLRC